MRLLILGASGGCGRWASRLAAEAGHDVVAMVRPRTPFDPPSGVRVERGSALDPLDLARAIDGREAVVSCVGAKRVNPRNPWSPLQSPPDASEQSARALVSVLNGTPIRRVVAISAAGVGDSFGAANGVIRFLIRRSTVGAMYADLEKMEQIFFASPLDWLAVRPVTLIDTAPTQRARIVTRFRLSSVIGRADVAQWLVRAATATTPVTNRTPMIGWW